MPMMDFQGKQIEVDDDGYIINLDDWTKELSVHLAGMDGIHFQTLIGRLSLPERLLQGIRLLQ